MEHLERTTSAFQICCANDQPVSTLNCLSLNSVNASIILMHFMSVEHAKADVFLQELFAEVHGLVSCFASRFETSF